jgi:prepilin-type processing-associated H-X9-DG protein
METDGSTIAHQRIERVMAGSFIMAETNYAYVSGTMAATSRNSPTVIYNTSGYNAPTATNSLGYTLHGRKANVSFVDGSARPILYQGGRAFDYQFRPCK